MLIARVQDYNCKSCQTICRLIVYEKQGSEAMILLSVVDIYS